MYDKTRGGRPEYQLGSLGECILDQEFPPSWNFLVSDRVDEDAFDASCSDARVANNYNVLRKWMSSHQFHFNSISIQLSLEIG